MTESGERERFEPALEALRQWEADTGSPAKPTEGNAFIDGFRAGSASQGAAMKRRYLTDQEACPECDGTCRISEGNKLVCYHCWLMETPPNHQNNPWRNVGEGHTAPYTYVDEEPHYGVRPSTLQPRERNDIPTGGDAAEQEQNKAGTTLANPSLRNEPVGAVNESGEGQTAEQFWQNRSHNALMISVASKLSLHQCKDLDDAIVAYGRDFAATQVSAALAGQQKYETLYAEARESLCSCNHTDTPEKGPLYDYTCDWCAQHPEGAEPPPIIKRMWELEAELARLREAAQMALEVIAALIISGPHPELSLTIKLALRDANDKLLAALSVAPSEPKEKKS